MKLHNGIYWTGVSDAPSRGHDLKLEDRPRDTGDKIDAPSRGHDLKRKKSWRI